MKFLERLIKNIDQNIIQCKGYNKTIEKVSLPDDYKEFLRNYNGEHKSEGKSYKIYD